MDIPWNSSTVSGMNRIFFLQLLIAGALKNNAPQFYHLLLKKGFQKGWWQLDLRRYFKADLIERCCEYFSFLF